MIYRLAIIIINYRTPHFIKDCLESLVRQINPNHHRVVIVDNASGDGSDFEIEKHITVCGWTKCVTIERSPFNGGFAAGNNYGIRRIRAEAYLLLNSDTIVRPGAIEQLLEAYRRYPAVGLFSPRLEWSDGRPQESCFYHRKPYIEFFTAARTKIVDQLFAAKGGPYPLPTKPIYPDWTSFACVLIRYEVFKRIGLLDEGYFMYFDDMDFCQRAWASGIPTLHLPSSRVVHLRGGSSPTKQLVAGKKRPPKYWYASRNRYYAKFYGHSGLWFANFCWYAGRLISLLREVLGLKKPHTCERQWLDIWTNVRQPLSKPNLLNR